MPAALRRDHRSPPLRDDRRPPLPALTGVRAFAAYGPILWHTLNFVDQLLPLSRHGYLGVDFFFMLSGFVLAYVHAEEMARPSWPLYGRFLGLRLGRIWPAYIAVLLLVGAAAAWREGWWAHPFDAEQQRFVLHALMLQGWGIVNPNEFNWPGWSVSAEWFVYLMFPLFVLGLGRAGRSAALLGIPLAIALLAAVFVAAGYDGININNGVGLVRAACEFAAGFLLWRLFIDDRVRRWDWSLIGMACLVGLGLLLALTQPRSWTDFLFVLLFAPLLLSLAFARGPLAAVCAWRPIVFLGEASYSIYLVHFPILWRVAALLNTFGTQLPPWLSSVIGIGATVLLSTVAGIVLHLIVERPARRWARHRLGYRDA